MLLHTAPPPADIAAQQRTLHPLGYCTAATQSGSVHSCTISAAQARAVDSSGRAPALLKAVYVLPLFCLLYLLLLLLLLLLACFRSLCGCRCWQGGGGALLPQQRPTHTGRHTSTGSGRTGAVPRHSMQHSGAHRWVAQHSMAHSTALCDVAYQHRLVLL